MLFYRYSTSVSMAHMFVVDLLPELRLRRISNHPLFLASGMTISSEYSLQETLQPIINGVNLQYTLFIPNHFNWALTH